MTTKPKKYCYAPPPHVEDKWHRIAATLGLTRAAVLNLLISEWRGKK